MKQITKSHSKDQIRLCNRYDVFSQKIIKVIRKKPLYPYLGSDTDSLENYLHLPPLKPEDIFTYVSTNKIIYKS